MRKTTETATLHLASLSNQIGEVSLAYERHREALRTELRRSIHSAAAGMPSGTAPRASLTQPFTSSWLPGPLSYPWLMMLASIPQIIEQLFLVG